MNTLCRCRCGSQLKPASSFRIFKVTRVLLTVTMHGELEELYHLSEVADLDNRNGSRCNCRQSLRVTDEHSGASESDLVRRLVGSPLASSSHHRSSTVGLTVTLSAPPQFVSFESLSYFLTLLFSSLYSLSSYFSSRDLGIIMKVFTLLPLAALTTAIVLPDESVMSQVAIESHEATSSFFEDIKSKIPSKDDVLEFFEDEFSSIIDTSENALDEAFCDALDEATDGFQAAATTLDEEYFDVGNWFASGDSEIIGGHDDDERPPHHGRPGRGKKGKKGRKGGKGRKGRKGRKGGKHGKGGKRGHRHHRPHHGHKKSNKTVYELIAGSKYTTKLAELINDDDYLVDLLNGTTANFTVFVPTDKAFEKIPKHGKDKKPPKDIIRKILKHHISAEFYPAGRVLVTRTVPTLLEGEYLSHDPESTPQRLSTNIGFRGLTVNYYSRIVAVNIVRNMPSCDAAKC